MTTSGHDAVARLRAAAESVTGVEEAAPLLRREARLDRARPAAPRPADALPAAAGPPAVAYGGDLPDDPGFPTTLQEALRLAAELAPEQGIVYLTDGDERFQSYSRLLDDAQRLLTGLRSTGIAPGESVLFQFGDNRAFITAFWACVLGGYLPTPVGAAPGYDRENAVTTKLRNAWQLLDRPLILTDSTLAPAVAKLSALWDADDLRVAVVEELCDGPRSTDWFPATPDSPAVHLLTSGSTGVPKVVRHAGRSILARTRAVAAVHGFDSDEVALNWMPLDHVGGIIMWSVRDVVLRCRHVNATIDAFLADPLRWLDWIDRYGVTNTWAPNFAFALVNERAAAMAGRSWDLSTLRHLLNGGEAVVSRTADRFIELLTAHGMPADTMSPSWGMSETSSGVTYSTLRAGDPDAGRLRVDKSSLGGALRWSTDPDAVVFTEVGPPVPGVRLRIVDPNDDVLPEDHVGRLQITGPTIMEGYFRNAEANAEAFTADGWFSTGDLAFLHRGRLTITGREKDLIIVQGANILSYDVESIVEQVEGTEVTYVAACGWSGAGDSTDKLVIFFVPASDDRTSVHDTIAAIKARVAEALGLQPDLVIPVERRDFPKTGSGKIQRAQLIADLDGGEYAEWCDEPDGPWYFERTWTELPAERGALPPGPWLVPEALREELGTVPGVPELLASPAGGATPAGHVGAVVHLAQGPDAESVALDVLRLVQDLAAYDPAPPLLVVTSGGLWTAAGDTLDLATAALPGLLRTAAAERVLPSVRQLDVPDPADRAAAIVTELACHDAADLVAHRGTRRLVPRLRPMALDERGRDAFVTGGRYLVTGGLGGVAHTVAEYLLAAHGAKLLLVGRSPADRGERAERLDDLGVLGDVAYRALDVADPVALRAAVRDAEARWGAPLDGVLHLAGADVSHQWARLELHQVARESPQAFRDAYRAKVTGTLALAGLLEDRPDTPLVLFSSVNGEFGGSSFAAYSSANSFLHGFADHWGRERGRPVHCLAWSSWSGPGMNRGAPEGAAEARGFRTLDPDEGLASLLAVLGQDRGTVLVGLDGRNEHIARALAPDSLHIAEAIVVYTGPASEADVRAAVAPVARELDHPLRCLRVEKLPVDRDQLLSVAVAVLERGGREFVPPATELEQALAALWTDVLGTDVGRDDRFFDLGGSSLRAAQLVNRVNSALTARLSVHHLYEHPTVGSLAAVLSPQLEGERG
ncbi:non-ribosomal peptide synthetase [Streptomyces sp. AS13]|uniref:non-ribosomal peptide synthetase n=1 Tax=Streptomyces sp. AS13 TaxID=3038080 RepID=UPI00278BD81B|nr:non-ribosomal peptide synthetase [Streptomyces sp. AS13]